jgi:hypothetical protein
MDQYYPQSFPIETNRAYTQQILSGLDAFHTNYIIHGDLKPHNILVKVGVIWARGFVILITGYSANVVTLWYRTLVLVPNNSDLIKGLLPLQTDPQESLKSYVVILSIVLIQN